MSKVRRILIHTLGTLATLAIIDAWVFYVQVPFWEPEFTSISPNGRFTVSAYWNPGIIPLPAQFHPRGNSGTVVLRDNKKNKTLNRAVADYVRRSGDPHVDWFEKTNSVGVVSVDVWNLPAPEEPWLPPLKEEDLR